IDCLLLIARSDAGLFGKDPNLQKMHDFRLRGIKLTVRYTSARAHSLHFTWTNHRAVAKAVSMFERSFEDIGYDFHVPMTVARESFAGLNTILVDDTQLAKAYVLRVVVLSERKRVAAIQPIQAGYSARFRFAYCDHLRLFPFLFRQVKHLVISLRPISLVLP